MKWLPRLMAILTIATAVLGIYAASVSKDRDSPSSFLPDPGSAVEVPEHVELINIAGNGRPEFVRIDGEIFAVPEAKSWLDRWGLPVLLGILSGIFALATAIATSVLQRARSGAAENDQLAEILRLLEARLPPAASG